ncbi:NUDIX domain-containing protein [Marinicrinis sediminis]|uniref:NUDIX domain-containing protein n=1 Tax=Marinicrinis sediminis TaxID=1652465 RepID=A0ABW5RDD3_9BACL
MDYVTNIRRKIGHDPLLLVGVAVIHLGEPDTLLLVRKNNGDWGLPGGLMELGETPEQTAQRELYEELSVHASGLQLVTVLSGPDFMFALPNEDQVCMVTILYETCGLEGELQPDREEITAYAYHHLQELAAVVPARTHKLIQAWQSRMRLSS